MQTYSEYRPTCFDAAGLGSPERRDWLVVPVGRNRDSSPSTESNFSAALAGVGGQGDDAEVHRFGHWGCGWFEIILVRPGSAAAEAAELVEKSLADYPLLNEDDASKREYESYLEQWDTWGADDFVSAIKAKLGLDDDMEELLLDADKQSLRVFFEGLVPSGDYRDDGAPAIRRSLHYVTHDDVERFIGTIAADPSP